MRFLTSCRMSSTLYISVNRMSSMLDFSIFRSVPDAIPRFGDKRSDIERFHDHAAHGKVLDGMQVGCEQVGVREDRTVLLAKLLHHRHTAELRHHDVEEHDVVVIRCEHRNRFAAVMRRGDLIAGALEHRLHHRADGWVIVDNENSALGVHDYYLRLDSPACRRKTAASVNH